MTDDDLEVIDLSPEEEPRGRREQTFQPSRRQVAIAAVCVGAVALAAALLASHSHHDTATPAPRSFAPAPAPTYSSETTLPPTVPTTIYIPPVTLNGLAAGRFVAQVAGTPVLVTSNGPPRTMLADISDIVWVEIAQQGAVLIGYAGTSRIIVGPTFDGVTDPLPAGIDLLPDEEGRWWSNFGQLQSSHELRRVRFPGGTTAVAKLRTGYLLVDSERTGLFEWRSGTGLTKIGAGNAEVLAIANNRVAWTDSTDTGVHVTNLTNARTITFAAPGSAVTARFSPDGSRLAVLVNGGYGLMVLADSATGHLVAELRTSGGGGQFPAFADVPPAFEPVPFSWDANGRLIVTTETAEGRFFLETIDDVSGALRRTVDAPFGLRQLILLGP